MDVLEAIRLRRSVRAYSGRAIPEDVTARLCEALRDAPSACNNQPWRFVLVFDEQLRRHLWRVQETEVDGRGAADRGRLRVSGPGIPVDGGERQQRRY